MAGVLSEREAHVSVDDLVVPVVVVGAGGAGMFAAITAAKHGFSVILLEKSVRRGCNTELSGGLIQAAGTRIQRDVGVDDSAMQMFDDIMRKNNYRSDPAIVAAVAQRSVDVIDLFMDDIGLELHLDQNVLYYGHSVHRMHAAPTETGAELVDGLRRYINGHSLINLVDNAEFTDAQPHESGWEITVRHGGEVEDVIVGQKLILACDGFGGNSEMLKVYCPEIADAVYIGSENNTGNGIEIAKKLGAACDLMTAYQGHSHVNPKYGTRLGGSLPNLGSVMVNTEGRRFEREDHGYSEYARYILAQPGGVAVEVFDGHAYEAAMATGAFREAVEVGAVKHAPTLARLAEQFDLPVDTFVAEIECYNAEVDGVDWLGRSDARHALSPPFYGAVVTGAIAHTQGGVRIDPACKVLSEDDEPIDGLFAAGGTTAGISGDAPEGYMSGNGLIQAFTTGLIAAESATRELLADSRHS
jgi:fumarate reductase flavoprotein subunit